MTDYTTGPVSIERRAIVPKAMQMTTDNYADVVKWLHDSGALIPVEVSDRSTVLFQGVELDPKENYVVVLDEHLRVEVLDEDQFMALYKSV